MNPKVVIIGLDGATLDLIEPWATAGYLPALAHLMSEGAYGPMLSTPNLHSASAWTSIMTGLNPGRHGLFLFSDRDFQSGQRIFFTGGDREGEILSAHFARNKMAAGLINVPMTYPAECQPGGFMISGLDAPALGEQAFCPAPLREEVLSRFPDYNFTPPALGDLMSAGRVREAIAEWLRLIDAQTAVAEYLLEARPVELLMTVYTASDWAGHNLWKYFDASHPEHTGAESDELKGAMLSIYRALDAAIARLLEKVDEATQVYVISDHGTGPHIGGSWHLSEWLEALGYMARKGRTQSRAGAINTARSAGRLLPAGVRERVKSWIGSERLKNWQYAERDSFYSSIDWERSTAYTEPGLHAINVNLIGRNSRGTVSEADYDALCRRIAEDLGGWVDARGIRVVDRVERRDEVVRGPYTNRAHDLYIQWNRSAYVGGPTSELRSRGYWWSGDHLPEGVLICKGPGIGRGPIKASASVYDFLPTLMYLAGLPVPAGLDGRVIEEVCMAEFLSRNPLRVESQGAVRAAESGSLTPAEEKLMEEKLRGLGYL